MKKIKYIDLVFENCEDVRLLPSMFRNLHIGRISKYYYINSAQYKKGEMWDDMRCEQFSIVILADGLDAQVRMGRVKYADDTPLRDRLRRHADLTHISLVFSDNTKEYIGVPWKGEEWANEAQKHKWVTASKDPRAAQWYGSDEWVEITIKDP